MRAHMTEDGRTRQERRGEERKLEEGTERKTAEKNRTAACGK